MSEQRPIHRFTIHELGQIARMLNRSEAALQERYRHLREQTEELLPRHERRPHHEGIKQ